MMIWDTISWCLTIVVWCEIVHQPVNFASMGGNSKVPQTSWYVDLVCLAIWNLA